MKTLLTSTALLALIGSAASAGSLDEPAQPAPVVITEVAAPSADWTGAYVGAQVGYADVNTNLAGVNGNGGIGGIVAGYDWDLGDWVVGLGLDYDFANVDVGGAATLENVLRVKARGGRKIGTGLAYGTAGYAHGYTDTLADDGGFFVGAGYEQMVTDQFSVGAEVLYHEFSDFNGSGVTVDATTIQLRGLFRF